MKKFYEELKRRNVIKSALSYLVIAWVLLQVASILSPIINAPEWVLQTFTAVLIIGLPVWIIISWIYDITPKGIEKTTKDSKTELASQVTNKRLNVFIIVSLSIAVLVMGLKLSNVFSFDSDKQYAIAVLYFDNFSADEDNEWLSEGMTESITTHLNPNNNLSVIGRTSVKKYRESDKTIPEIARELNVSHLVEGSVMKHDDQLKITTQLINAENEHVWSEEYLVSFDDFLSVQTEIAKQIVQQLKLKLTTEEETQLLSKPTESIEAFKLFQKGRSLADDRSKKGLESSIEYYQQAIKIDPNYAEAYAEIANSYYIMERYYGNDYKSNLENVNNYIDKALKIDPNVGRAYTVRANIFKDEKKWDKAKEYFEKAIALNPNDATAHHHFSAFYQKMGDSINGLIHINIAQRLEPVSVIINMVKIGVLLANHKIKEAEEHYDKIKFIFPTDYPYWISEKLRIIVKKAEIISMEKKDRTESIKLYHKEIVKNPDMPDLYRQLGIAYDRILNDGKNYLKYCKKAYELDSTKIAIVNHYSIALLKNGDFKDSQKLMQSKNFNALFPKSRKLLSLFYYHYYQGNYKKAEEILKDSLLSQHNYAKSLILSQLGKVKEVYQLFKDQDIYNETKATVFAILEKRDSMYHYLNFNDIDFEFVNSSREFDPYRKEEQYKTLLKKHYLPITHWNE